MESKNVKVEAQSLKEERIDVLNNMENDGSSRF